MCIILDILITVFLTLLVIMIFSGFISLLERNLMAILQNRIGPALFLFGFCTPIFDGINLILNFNLIVLNVDVLYLFLIVTSSFFFNYVVLYYLPITSIVIINVQFFHFIFLSFHTMLNVIDVFLVGCYILTTCFIYMAAISTLLCSLLSEFCLILFFLFVLNVTPFSMMMLNIVNTCNVLLMNFFVFPVTIFLIFVICLYLNILINIFEYAEAESELVAGVITEYSGLFFCISSLIEIFHVIMSVYLILFLFFGGVWLNLNFVVVIITVFIIPKLIVCSMNLNNMFLFIIFYVYNFLFLYFISLHLTNIMYLFMY